MMPAAAVLADELVLAVVAVVVAELVEVVAVTMVYVNGAYLM
jgi:hypothetical protein